MKNAPLGMVASVVCGVSLSVVLVQQGRAEEKSAVKTPMSVANMLDKIVQPRFHKDSGKFGLTRLGLQGHSNVLNLREEVPEDRALLKKVKESGYSYALGFYRCAHKPGTHFVASDTTEKDVPKPEVVQTNYYWTIGVTRNRQYFSNGEDGVAEDEAARWVKEHGDSLQKACDKALPALRQGKSVDAKQRGYLIAMRPVRATAQSCLGCHEGAKMGDTLGVLVYSVRTVKYLK